MASSGLASIDVDEHANDHVQRNYFSKNNPYKSLRSSIASQEDLNVHALQEVDLSVHKNTEQHLSRKRIGNIDEGEPRGFHMQLTENELQ